MTSFDIATFAPAFILFAAMVGALACCVIGGTVHEVRKANKPKARARRLAKASAARRARLGLTVR